MSNPQPQPGRRLPPRAEPAQGDRSFKGDGVEHPNRGQPDEGASTQKQKRQSEDALDNVRDGY